MTAQKTFAELMSEALQSNDLQTVKDRLEKLASRCNEFNNSATDLYPDGDPAILRNGHPSDRTPKGNPIGGGLLGGVITGMQ